MAVNASRGPTYKVVLLGELGVGKTCLFRRLKDNTFDEFSTATAGIDSCTKTTKVDGDTITMNIWDTAGVERFRTLTRNYYRNAHAAVFIYSVTEVSSLHYLSQWEKDAQSFAPNAVRMLIGNKIDLEAEVDEFTAQSFAKTHAFELDAMISCKTNKGVKEAFDDLAKLLHDNNKESNQSNEGTVQLGATQQETTERRDGACAC